MSFLLLFFFLLILIHIHSCISNGLIIRFHDLPDPEFKTLVIFTKTGNAYRGLINKTHNKLISHIPRGTKWKKRQFWLISVCRCLHLLFWKLSSIQEQLQNRYRVYTHIQYYSYYTIFLFYPEWHRSESRYNSCVDLCISVLKVLLVCNCGFLFFSHGSMLDY